MVVRTTLKVLLAVYWYDISLFVYWPYLGNMSFKWSVTRKFGFPAVEVDKNSLVPALLHKKRESLIQSQQKLTTEPIRTQCRCSVRARPWKPWKHVTARESTSVKAVQCRCSARARPWKSCKVCEPPLTRHATAEPEPIKWFHFALKPEPFRRRWIETAYPFFQFAEFRLAS